MKIAHTRPPAKLNLFLELLGKRDDGFHEIDTVMVPIDLCDELKLWRHDQSTIDLEVDWLPSAESFASRLGVQLGTPQSNELLGIPDGPANLVHRALMQFTDRFGVAGGFGCQLLKRIPAGAGMGGASSDAASALLAAATLCGIPHDSAALVEIAASLGSDVPFFLGDCGRTIHAARARGRGEIIEPLSLARPLHFVVVFPAASLSTPKVYRNSSVPSHPQSGDDMAKALLAGECAAIKRALSNRLTQSAKEILPRIDEILDCMWREGMQACQLTGSGSACFALVSSIEESQRWTNTMRSMLEPGAFTVAACSVSLPAEVKVIDD